MFVQCLFCSIAPSCRHREAAAWKGRRQIRIGDLGRPRGRSRPGHRASGARDQYITATYAPASRVLGLPDRRRWSCAVDQEVPEQDHLAGACGRTPAAAIRDRESQTWRLFTVVSMRNSVWSVVNVEAALPDFEGYTATDPHGLVENESCPVY